MKKAVLFIHGRGGHVNQWNETSTGKKTNLETMISQKTTSLRVQIDNFDEPPLEVYQRIVELMAAQGDKTWTVVCHSLGAIYGLMFLAQYPKMSGLVLIDPTPFDMEFVEKLHVRAWNNLAEYIYNTFIVGQKIIPAKVKIHLHFDYEPSQLEEFNRKIDFYTAFSMPNLKSRLQIHPGKGHMLLHSDAPKIYDSIMTIL